MLDDEDLQRVYQWVDEIPLSRPKRNIARDFSDGLLTAEIVQHYFPKLIELHNYPAANSYAQKMYNWKTLNSKVFKKMGFQLQQEEMDNLCNCTLQQVEKMLKNLQERMAKYSAKKQAGDDDDDSSHRAAYKPPPKPAVKAPTVPRAPKCSSASAANAAPSHARHSDPSARQAGDAGSHQILAEKDAQLLEMRETVSILEVKIQKLEQLVRLKDSKIATLKAKLEQSAQSTPRY